MQLAGQPPGCVRHVRRVTGEATGNFVALLRPSGDLHVAVSDFEVLRHVNRPYLEKHEPLFAGAALIVLDLNLSEEAIGTCFELAGRFGVRVAVDPTSPALAESLARARQGRTLAAALDDDLLRTLSALFVPGGAAAASTPLATWQRYFHHSAPFAPHAPAEPRQQDVTALREPGWQDVTHNESR